MITKAPRQQLDRAADVSLALSKAVKQEDWAQVLDLCWRALPTARSKANVYSLMGKAFAGKGDDSSAIAAYQESICLKLAQPESHYALGILYSRQKKPMRAICHYQWALKFRPNWPRAAFRLGQLFRQIGAYEQATETYQSILRRDPTYADARLALGRLYEYRGNFQQAAKQYGQAVLSQEDKSSASISDRAMAYRYLGSALVQLQQPQAAIEACREAMALQPANALSYIQLGQSLIANGDKIGAFEAYQQVLQLDPDSATAHHYLGQLWLNHQNLDKAISHFQRAIQQAPERPGVLSSCAKTLSVQGRWRDLFDCFKLAIAQQPKFVDAYCQRVIQLSDEDLLFRVQRVCGRFLMGLQHADIDMAYNILCDRLAQIYKYLGDLSVACDAPALAVSHYQRSLAIRPEDIESYSRLADCLIGQGRLAAGIAIAQAGLLQTKTLSGQIDAEPVSIQQIPDKQTSIKQISIEQISTQQIDIKKVSIESTVAQTKTAETAIELQLQAILHQGLDPSGAQASLPGKIALEKIALKGAYRRTQDWLDNQLDNQIEASASASAIAIATEEIAPPSPTCGGVTCQTCMGSLIAQFSPTQIGKRAFRCNRYPAANHLTLPTFTAAIPNGRAWIAPKKNAWAVCHEIAVFTPDNFLLADLSRSYPWYLPGCKEHDPTSHTIFQRVEPLPPPQKLSGKVVLLSGLSGHIYYHWLFDVLPRLDILQQHLQQQDLDVSGIDYFVVNNCEKKYQIETLQALGVPIKKVIASDRFPHIIADELIVPSFAGHFDWVPPSTIDFLRDRFLGTDQTAPAETAPAKTIPATHNPLPKRIYISREQANYRKIFNEAAVVKLLGQFGFTTVTPETMSVAQQAQLFAQADIIVAPHGSGLANLAFCSPGTTVVECFSPHYLRTDYWMISQYLRLNHYYLVGEGFTCDALRQLMYPSELTEDFSVDITALRSLLAQLIEAHPRA